MKPKTMTAARKIEIAPQEGPQTMFLSTPADIAFYGGSAGGGKSFALLIEPLRHYKNKDFGGVIFRRNATQIKNEGGLWDESENVYPYLRAVPREHFLEWNFPSGMRMKFSHLEYDKTVLDWQGSAIAYLGYDEVTHFTSKQFWYMLSRNRSTCGVKPYIRATCNPDVKSWVRELIDWWIDSDTGLPIPERSGTVRYFIRQEDTLMWAETCKELLTTYGEDCNPKSFTFIAAKLTDNQILMKKDPGYLSNLKALSRVDRLRLLEGNWNVRATAGMIFQRQWFPILDAIPPNPIRRIRFWDRAATRPNEENPDPDWTRGLLLLEYSDKTYLVTDMRSLRDTPGQVEKLITDTAAHDGIYTTIASQQDPGSAGVAEAENFVKMLRGYDVKTSPNSNDKVTRAKPVSAQAEVGNIKVLRAPWNEDFFTELENFSEDGDGHDDQVDVLSGSFNTLNQAASILDAY